MPTEDRSCPQSLLNVSRELRGFGTIQKILKYTHHSRKSRPPTSCELVILRRYGDRIRIHHPFLSFPSRRSAEEVTDILTFGMTLFEHTVIVMTMRVRAHGRLRGVHPTPRRQERYFPVVASPRHLDVFNQFSHWQPRLQYSKT
jgi:hypothetical protein